MFPEDAPETLALESRNKVYQIIEASPGLHFRELQRRSGLAVGALQYHLDTLQKNHLIRVEKQGRFNRYFSVRGAQLGEQEKTISVLRQESARKIILFLLEKKQANNFDIANVSKLSASTVSWHLTKLVEAGIVSEKRAGRQKLFFVSNPQQTAQLLVSYKKTFFDELVDNFVDTWQELGEQ
jgi:predicted transcriptional regulator